MLDPWDVSTHQRGGRKIIANEMDEETRMYPPGIVITNVNIQVYAHMMVRCILVPFVSFAVSA